MRFRPGAKQGTRDFGLLYVGAADGGSGGDPLDNAEKLSSAFGKILRIDPLGTNSRNKKYGIPADNPFVKDGDPNTLDEIYAYGVRNPQRFAWDPRNGNLFVADIGQNTVEEVSIVTSGANLGWNNWEGSYTYLGRGGVGIDKPRGDAKHHVPGGRVRPGRSAAPESIGGHDGVRLPADGDQGAHQQGGVRRQPERRDLLLRRRQPAQGRAGSDQAHPAERRQRAPKTLLQIIKETNTKQGKMPATRADLRFGQGSGGADLPAEQGGWRREGAGAIATVAFLDLSSEFVLSSVSGLGSSDLHMPHTISLC